ncbi:carbohydrate ABC transporter permease [Deinococcus roseus]|nr:carbohydrate ABC transporter permease [Deinococcus roseus]
MSQLTPTRPGQKSSQRSRTWTPAHVFSVVLLLLVCLTMLFPLFWMITTALKSNSAIYQIPPRLWPEEFHWENFINGFKAINFGKLFLNSSILAVLNVVGSVFSSMVIAYGLSRIRFPGRKVWFYIFIGSMMLPAIVTTVPLFKLFLSIGWYQTWWPLIVPAFLGNPFFIFLAYQYYFSIPLSIDEAARMDGANHWIIFTRIMVPLTRPVWIAMCVYAFQGSWNDYLNPLIYLPFSPEKWPLSVGMASFAGGFAGVAATRWNEFMATNLLYMLPSLVVFFVAQNHFMAGMGALSSRSSK